MNFDDFEEDPIEQVSKSLNLENFAKEDKSTKNSRLLKKAFADRLKKLEATLNTKKLSKIDHQELSNEIDVLKSILNK